MSEVYNMREGELSWVSASGNSNAFATAANSPSGVAVAFIRDFTYDSARTVNTVMNRGVPHHHKTVDQPAINTSFSYGYSGGNGVPDYPVHLQLKLTNGTISAFHIINHALRTTHSFAEAAEENTMSDAFVALGMLEATASGYLG